MAPKPPPHSPFYNSHPDNYEAYGRFSRLLDLRICGPEEPLRNAAALVADGQNPAGGYPLCRRYRPSLPGVGQAPKPLYQHCAPREGCWVHDGGPQGSNPHVAIPPCRPLGLDDAGGIGSEMAIHIFQELCSQIHRCRGQKARAGHPLYRAQSRNR